MGQRQAALERMLLDSGHVPRAGILPRPSASCRDRGDAKTWAEIGRVYRQLGGILDLCPLQPGPWDLELAGVAVELDEEQHFNRYRALTLESTLYARSRFPVNVYRGYCHSYEGECLRKAANRGYWASPSTIAQFGPAGILRNLDPPGAPRWKHARSTTS